MIIFIINFINIINFFSNSFVKADTEYFFNVSIKPEDINVFHLSHFSRNIISVFYIYTSELTYFYIISWEQRKLTDFVEFYNGQTYSPLNVQDNGTLFLSSSNVQNGEISTADSVFIDSRVINTNNVKIGDIIVVVRNGSRNLIGKHAQIKDKMPNTVIGAFMTGIRTNNSNFVNSLLNTPIFDNEINKNMGATINQITGYMFSNIEFKRKCLYRR